MINKIKQYIYIYIYHKENIRKEVQSTRTSNRNQKGGGWYLVSSRLGGDSYGY
jgi:uncharacterized protein (UPF0333 family)